MEHLILNEIKLAKEKGHRWIENYAYSLKTFVRIINDRPVKFPLTYEMIGYKDLIEISHLKWNKHPNKGWCKPDKIIGNVEIFYLWKQFKKDE